VQVNVAMAIFVLPLNSVLNPFLYTFNILMEKIQSKREEKLKNVLMARIKIQVSGLREKKRQHYRGVGIAYVFGLNRLFVYIVASTIYFLSKHYHYKCFLFHV
jgi:hypothetical protein